MDTSKLSRENLQRLANLPPHSFEGHIVKHVGQKANSHGKPLIECRDVILTGEYADGVTNSLRAVAAKLLKD